MGIDTTGHPAVLAADERDWAHRQPFLKANGYDLRPRYQPGWQPSWEMIGDDWMDAEDALGLPVRHCITHGEYMLIDPCS